MDENLSYYWIKSWKGQIKYNENKISRSLELLYIAKNYLDKGSLIVLNHFFIHTYINYGNIVWGNTNRINLKKINSQKK